VSVSVPDYAVHALRVVSKIGPELSRGVMNKVKDPSQLSDSGSLSDNYLAQALALSARLGRRGNGLQGFPLVFPFLDFRRVDVVVR
jgi:hypothetical protein